MPDVAYSLFDPMTLIPAVQQIKPARTFIKDLFFPEVRTFDTEFILADLQRDVRRMAPIVSLVSGGKVMARRGYETDMFKPPLVAPRAVTTVKDIIKRLPGEALFNGMSPQERQAVLLGKDLAELDKTITRREEWMCAQALTTGVLNLKGDDVDYEIDYQLDSGNTQALSGAALWSASTATPLDDLREWKMAVLQASGINCDVCIIASNVYPYFVNNAQVQAMMAAQGGSTFKVLLGTLDPKPLAKGATYLGPVTSIGVDVYSYWEWYIDDTTGDEMPMIPDNTVILASSEADYFMGYAAYIDMNLMGAMNLDREQATMAMPRYPRSWVEEGPNVRYLELDSRPLPILENKDSWFIGTVL
jgi:hypothetical protein